MLEQLIELDHKLFLFLNGLHSEWLNSFMVFISGQGLWVPLLAASFYFAFKAFPRKQFYLFLLFLGLVLIMSDVTSSYVLKNLTERLRPCRDLDLKPFVYSFGQKCGGRFGFVSSHAANSLALSLFCFKVVPLPRFFSYLLLALPVMVSYSRIYLGVHFPGDILGGFLVGLFWTSVFSYFWKHLKVQDV